MHEQTNDIYSSTEDLLSSSSIEFILLLIIEILSLSFTLVILTFLLYHWKSLIRKAVRNHVIFILIIISLIYLIFDLPFTINSYRLGYDQPRNTSFCIWWYWIDYTLIIISIFLTAAASLQRHILIFHAHWLHSHRARVLFHYLPIAICMIYPIVFYLSAIIFYPCQHSSNETDEYYCSEPCYTNDLKLFNFDWIFNTGVPLMMILFGNVILIFRVIRSMKKTRRRQSLIWRRQRKLALQLFALSSLFFFGWAPSTIISILQSFRYSNLLDDYPQLNYLNYLTYFVCPLQTFTCLLGIPEFMKSITKHFRRIHSFNHTGPVRTIQNTLTLMR